MSDAETAKLPLVVDAPVREVTLFEDRARVVRSGTVELSQGTPRVRIEAVAPVLSDASVSVRIEPASGARAADSWVRRRVVGNADAADAESTDARDLENERDALDREIAQRSATLNLLEREAELFDQLARVTVSEIAEDATWGRDDRTLWTDSLEHLAGREREAQGRLVDLRFEIDETKDERERLQRRLEARKSPAQRESAAVEVQLVVDQPGEYTLSLEYVVPGACWRPYHTARLIDSDPPRVELRTDACVWQNTGEDWLDVPLKLSTQRPSLGTEPPKLVADVLSAERKPEGVEVEVREQEIATTGLGRAEEAAATSTLPGIDDAGETVSLQAATASSVLSDGRPYRVPLTAFEGDAELERVAMPERLAAVVMRSVQTNRAESPILAGPVDLLREAGFCGRTSVLYVAPGEKFELGWGPDQELRVQRDTEVETEDQRLLSSWITRHTRVRVRLSNIGSRDRAVVVTERVPVSEVEKVVVKLDAKASSRGAEPDDDGFVRWPVRLGPFERTTLELKYTLKKHRDVSGI